MLLVTDGYEEGLTGMLVYCIKPDLSKELKMRNIADVRRTRKYFLNKEFLMVN